MTDECNCEHGELIADIRAALSTVMAKHEQGMVIRWVVIAETIDPAGERGTWQLTDSEAKPWETLGLLHHAIMIENAACTASYVRGENE
jgi:hypothetical protein